MILLVRSAVFQHLAADKASLCAVLIFDNAVQSNAGSLVKAVCFFAVSNDALDHKAGILIKVVILAFDCCKAGRAYTVFVRVVFAFISLDPACEHLACFGIEIFK